MIYDYNLIRYLPNKVWFINIFLILNESCITFMFSTAVVFAYLDKISLNYNNNNNNNLIR